MDSLTQLMPKSIKRVMDLVQEAGVNVSGWGNPANPKYCYNWSFVEPNKVVVLNLWHENLREDGSIVSAILNMRTVASEQTELAATSREKKSKYLIRTRRAIEMDVAIQIALRLNLPVRVIICNRTETSDYRLSDDVATVGGRELDTDTWHVSKYDWETGDCLLVRDKQGQNPQSQPTTETSQNDIPRDSGATVEDDTSWSKAELRASIIAYFEMQKKAANGEAINKSKYYADLSTEFGRSAKAFEFRMQNISYVLYLMGRSWIAGLKPKGNVGINIAVEIERLIGEIEGQHLNPVVAFEIGVKTELKSKLIARPDGQTSPARTTSLVTQTVRDPKVKAWILWNAGNKCECCHIEAPFLTNDGSPYLEVHHLKRLAEQGSDTIFNAVAVCPNCHRELHFGRDSLVLLDRMYAGIDRLVRE